MQITVRERNHWEGETFNYILELDEVTCEKIRFFLDKQSNVRVTLNTEYTKEMVDELNHRSRNTYMNEYDFYELPKGTALDEDLYSEIFYKGKGIEPKE